MHIMLTDETNRDSEHGHKFFIYGGLIMPVENIITLDEGIRKIRTETGYQPTDALKFDTNSRPALVSIEKCKEAKQRVIQLCSDTECVFIAYVILHKIIHNKSSAKKIQWAADHVIDRFNKYLEENNSHGICAIDNLPDMAQWRYLGEKFTTGLQYEDKTKKLNRIKMLCATCVQSSHACSAMDIVLGSFRYCVNESTNKTAATQMMKQITPMMWNHRSDNHTSVNERGLICRPIISNIKVKEYRDEYEALRANLNNLLNG